MRGTSMVASDALARPELVIAGRPAAAAHWRARLAGLGERSCPVADLAPSHDARPATATHAARLPAPLVRRLDEMSRQDPNALHVLLATTLVALLHRHGTGDEVVIGQPVPAAVAD